MKKKIITILVIVLILIALVLIWFIKNDKKNNENIINENNNKDFSFHITDEFDLEKLKQYKLPIILDFGSESCGPCLQMAPDLKKLNQNMQEKAIIKFIDVWKYPSLAEGYPIQLIPTQILINSDGTPYAPENYKEQDLMFYVDENEKHIFTAHVGALTYEQMYTFLKEMGLNE